jgi:SAM-dependent methyltransferase
MNLIELPRNVQFLYEEHLARIEFEALGCTDLVRDGDLWSQLRAHVNGQRAALLARSAYAGCIDGEPSVYGQLITPRYQGGLYNRTRSVNQYLTHWIYPYRGKFHSQMVRALLNLLGAGPGSVVGDFFNGSGTTAVEASLLGASFIGRDLSPLCVVLTRVKTQAWRDVGRIAGRVEELLRQDDIRLDADRESGLVRDFLDVARLVTASDTERRGRDEQKALRKNLAGMLESVQAFAAAVGRFHLNPGAVDVRLGDARALDVEADSVSCIVTSPPYSIALDYVGNDAHALEALQVDMAHLRDTMTGVRGRSGREKLDLYNADMREAFAETARVLVPGGRAAVVIGDATVDGREVTTTDQMVGWAEASGLRLRRTIPKIVFGLYSVMTDEKILVFQKE